MFIDSFELENLGRHKDLDTSVHMLIHVDGRKLPVMCLNALPTIFMLPNSVVDLYTHKHAKDTSDKGFHRIDKIASACTFL